MFTIFLIVVLSLPIPVALYFLLWRRRRRRDTGSKNNGNKIEFWVVETVTVLSWLAVMLLVLNFGEGDDDGGDLESKYVPASFEGGKIKPGEFRK